MRQDKGEIRSNRQELGISSQIYFFVFQQEEQKKLIEPAVKIAVKIGLGKSFDKCLPVFSFLLFSFFLDKRQKRNEKFFAIFRLSYPFS